MGFNEDENKLFLLFVTRLTFMTLQKIVNEEEKRMKFF